MNLFTFFKKRPQKMLLSRLLGILCFITTMIVSNPAFSQIPINNSFTPANCGNVNCTSSDVRVISAYLSGPGDMPIDCSIAGPFANAELHLIVFSNTQRIGVSISGTLNINGVATQVLFANCFTGITLNNGGNNNLKVIIPLPAAVCGDGFSLTDLFISWGVGQTDFCDGSTAGHCPETKAKCRYVPGETIPVPVKLEVDFSSLAGDCSKEGNSKTFVFTPQVVTSQNLQFPLDFAWDFGDGTTATSHAGSLSAADLAAAAVTHTYAFENTYTVTLVGSQRFRE
ncbi:hypothetical protein BH11BAC5_BH11BAC5_54700 [soil metagenome]